jgi:hypothetical protein
MNKSLTQVYIGNKFIGSHFPVLLVAGDNTWMNTYFGEHYLFVDFPKLPFLFRRTVISPRDANSQYFDFDSFPEVFSAEALLQNQFTAARAHLEYTLSILNRQAYTAIFWEGRPFAFNESTDSPLVSFALHGKYTKELASMFKFSRAKKLDELKDRLAKLPKIRMDEETGDVEA